MNLYFIRHGQSFVNLKEWERGNIDVGLTVLGERQAVALGKWLPSCIPQVDAIYASTMARARETAAAAAAPYKIPVQFDDRLREVGNNRFDHVPFPSDALPTTFADYWGSERPFSPIVIHEDVGETLMHFRTRVGIFIEQVAAAHRQQTVLVVCHGGVVEAAFNHIFNVGPWGRCEVWDHNTAVTYFEYVGHPGRETWRLHYHNRIDHLAGVE
jgi:broad specificity phosphatase PhoE